MIRRNDPLAVAAPERYLLIPQQEHARLSYELAAAWGNRRAAPLICSPNEPEHPLAGVRQEFLAAVLHHDDGWAEWWDNPGIDPQQGRPYSFTEMPPADAQRLWRASIDACRAIGPLAGWVVASHFSWLQSKADDDFHEWEAWLAQVDAERTPWLAEWLAASEHHTQDLAERCLAWLQAFDWMSLWLCCKCPAIDEPPIAIAPLAVGEEDRLEATTFTPRGEQVEVSPWPFRADHLSIHCGAARYEVAEPIDRQLSTPLRWRLCP